MPLTVFYITNNLEIALIAERAGVNRIFVDLETLGKEERQKGINSVKSHHTIQDIKVISSKLTKAQMLVRINPWNSNSKEEIEKVIQAGAEYIMLPMWKTCEEVKSFINSVHGRAKTNLLLETKEAVKCLNDVLKLDGIDEIHIGLNDLHLSYKLTFMFELLTNGTVEKIVNKIKKKNIPYGFGGISHLGDGMIPAEMIIKEHYRLGSSRAILSRGFCDQTKTINEIKREFETNMSEFRKFEKEFDRNSLNNNRKELIKRVNLIVEAKKNG
ncbi:MAG: aldolase [Bacilli bacterium]|nr:aldolase [Bacilli bacterium]